MPLVFSSLLSELWEQGKVNPDRETGKRLGPLFPIAIHKAIHHLTHRATASLLTDEDELAVTVEQVMVGNGDGTCPLRGLSHGGWQRGRGLERGGDRRLGWDRRDDTVGAGADAAAERADTSLPGWP